MCDLSVATAKMAGLRKAKKYDWNDSNMALFGSDTEKKVSYACFNAGNVFRLMIHVLCLQVKKESAETEPAWKGAGQAVGMQIWRIVKFKVGLAGWMICCVKLIMAMTVTCTALSQSPFSSSYLKCLYYTSELTHIFYVCRLHLGLKTSMASSIMEIPTFFLILTRRRILRYVASKHQLYVL